MRRHSGIPQGRHARHEERDEDAADTLEWDPLGIKWKEEALERMTHSIETEAHLLSRQLRERNEGRDQRGGRGAIHGTIGPGRSQARSTETPITTTATTSTPQGSRPTGPPTQRSQAPSRRMNRDQDEGPESMYPLMDTPAGRAMYVPWTHRDLKGVVEDLPPIKQGAGKWIRNLERLTTADRLTMGDIRAVLMRGEGPRAVNDVENVARTTREPDDSPFDPYRPIWWEALMGLYPPQNSAACMTGLKRKPSESAGEYLTRATERWKDGFGTRPGASAATEAMFRIAVETGLCTKTREGLKTVIGLGRMNAMDWEEAITHHVNLEQDREDEDVKKDRDLKKRLLRMDVKKATQEHNRDKKESNKDHASEIMPLEVATPPAPPPTPNPLVQPSGPPPTQMQAPPAQAWGPQPPPYPYPYPSYPYPTHPPSNPATQTGPGMYQNQQSKQRGGFKWRGRGRTPNTNPRSYPCFICGLMGHWAKECPQTGQPGMQHDQQDRQQQPGPTHGNPGNGPTHASNPGTPMYPLWEDPGYDGQY